MDTIFIHGLETTALIGIHPSERDAPQRVLFDLDLACDIGAAAATDDVANAINYQAVSERVIELATTSGYRLIETLAEHIAERLLVEFAIARIDLRLTKPDIMQPDVGVGISRQAGVE